MSTTLNISANDVRLLYIKGKEIKKWGVEPLEPDLIRDGLIIKPEAVAKVINGLFESTNISRDNVIVSVSSLSYTHRVLTLPKIKSELVDEAIQRAVRREMPLPVEELYLSWQLIASRPDENDYFVVGVPHNYVDALTKTLSEANVKLQVLDLRPLALARAANRANTMIAAMEPDCFDIVIIVNGIISIMHTATAREPEAGIGEQVRRLTDELSKTIRFHNSNNPDTPLASNTPLLLTGQLSAETTVRELIQDEIQNPVEPLVPGLQFPEDLPIESYTANIGLALREIATKVDTGFKNINLNLLVGKYKPISKKTPVRTILLSIVLVIAIGLLFPLYQLKSQAITDNERLQSELSTISRQLRQLRTEVEQAEAKENTINAINAEVEAYREEHQALLAERGEFNVDLKLINDNLPSQTHFNYIEIDDERISVLGDAEDEFIAIEYAFALERAVKFNEVRIAKIDEGDTEETDSNNGSIYFNIEIIKGE